MIDDHVFWVFTNANGEYLTAEGWLSKDEIEDISDLMEYAYSDEEEIGWAQDKELDESEKSQVADKVEVFIVDNIVLTKDELVDYVSQYNEFIN